MVSPSTVSAPMSLLPALSFRAILNILRKRATGKRSAHGYVVTAEATIAGGAQPGKVIALTCGPKAKCFMLKAAHYPARWVSSAEMELLGLSEDNRKFQKVHFSARPAS